MRPLDPPELSLDCRISADTIAGVFIEDILRIQDVPDKISKLHDYVNRLQDEMKKIEAFKRELPLSMLLVNDVIVRMKDELAKCSKSNSEPVLEEFIPLKNSSSTEVEEQDEKVEDSKEIDINNRDKMNWMSSVQLWSSDDRNNSPNTDLDKDTLKLENYKKRKEDEMNPPPMDSLFPSVKIKAVGRAFVPFKGSTNNIPVMKVGKEDKDELPGKLSLCMPEIKKSREEINPCGYISKSSFSKLVTSAVANGQLNLKTGQQQQTSRKQRRCWSPELHRRFVSALGQLGGPQVATPKQIRELMQVDGLTNDEVKSHLQKYRIHARKSQSGTNTSMVLGGGLWMSQEQCGESSKHRNSGSPTGPLQLAESSHAYGDDCMEDEDDYDEKSESHSWRR